DGAGLLTQIPAPLFYREAASRGIALAPGQPFAVGAFFLPRERDALGCATAIIEEVLCREGLPVLGWRDVPVDLDVLGAGARSSARSSPASFPTSPPRTTRQRSRSFTSATRRTRRRVGRSPSRSVCSPTTARSIRCGGTETRCWPASRRSPGLPGARRWTDSN